MQDQHDAGEPSSNPPQLAGRDAFAEPAARERRGEDRLQAGKSRPRAPPESNARSRSPCRRDRFHAPDAGDGAVRDADATGQRGAPTATMIAISPTTNAMRIASRVRGSALFNTYLVADEARAPQHDEDRRPARAAHFFQNRQSFGSLLPDHRLAARTESRRRLHLALLDRRQACSSLHGYVDVCELPAAGDRGGENREDAPFDKVCYIGRRHDRHRRRHQHGEGRARGEGDRVRAWRHRLNVCRFCGSPARHDHRADYTFDCTGNVTVMRQAWKSCHAAGASRS